MHTLLQVNYLSHWLLAHELLGQDSCPSSSHRRAESVASAEPRRLIFLSSMTHRAGHLDFSNLQLEQRYTGSYFAGLLENRLMLHTSRKCCCALNICVQRSDELDSTAGAK